MIQLLILTQVIMINNNLYLHTQQNFKNTKIKENNSYQKKLNKL